MTTNAPPTQIPPPRRPGYRERMLRVVPVFVRTASVVSPHTALAGAVEIRCPEVNWPGEWDGPMPGKRRRLARAREWSRAHSRWSRQLSSELSDELKAAILAARDPSLPFAAAALQRQVARALALSTLEEAPDAVSEFTAYAKDEATAAVLERWLKLSRLVRLAANQCTPSGLLRIARAALTDMHGKPIPRGCTPLTLEGAPSDLLEDFYDEVRREAHLVIERELDLLIATNPSDIARPVPAAP